jgi:hypothetical protein
MLLGGLIAAPMAAWLVRIMHPRMLGSLVGGVIIFTNTRTLLVEAGVRADARYLVLACVTVVWFGAIAIAVHAVLGERAVRQLASGDD